MNVIQYPTDEPYAHLRRAFQRDYDRVRALNERRRAVPPKLRTMFDIINRDTFGGKLPTPTFVIEEPKNRAALGQCAYQRGAWVEPFRISISPATADGPADVLLAVLRHEVAHVAQWALGGTEGAREAAHGLVFRRMLRRIDDQTGHCWAGRIDVEGEPLRTRAGAVA